MIRRILTYPQDKRTLRSICAEITDEHALRDVLLDLFDTLKANPRGVGLAAPQIGFRWRVFAVNYGGHIQGFVNPVILQTGPDVATGEEGCLSLPDCHALVQRATWIRVVKQQMRDVLGSTVTIEAGGMMARIIQHEIDHLQGIVMTMREAKSA